MLALDLATGQILWKTYLTPEGYPGVAVWGSSPAIDTKRGSVYIATGNNYDAPQSVLTCVAAAGSDTAAQAACLPADDHFDSILALDMRTGAVKWATRALPFDAWTVCVASSATRPTAPRPQDPTTTSARLRRSSRSSRRRHASDLVGAGQKSGDVLGARPEHRCGGLEVHPGPGRHGRRAPVGLGRRRQARLHRERQQQPQVRGRQGSTDTRGIWSALDATTGSILWQTRPTHGGSTSGPVTTANGVVFGCSLDPDG